MSESENKEIDPTRYSRSTGEREELLELARKLDLEQKRGSGGSGDSGVSDSVVEEATPAVITSANNIKQLDSSGRVARLRRAAYTDSAVQGEGIEREQERLEEEKVAPATNMDQLQSSGRVARLRRAAYIGDAIQGEGVERAEKKLEEEKVAPTTTGIVPEKVKEEDGISTEGS